VQTVEGSLTFGRGRGDSSEGVFHRGEKREDTQGGGKAIKPTTRECGEYTNDAGYEETWEEDMFETVEGETVKRKFVRKSARSMRTMSLDGIVSFLPGGLRVCREVELSSDVKG